MDGFNPEAPRYPSLPAIDDEDEWTYTNRRTMQEIIPGLFLGPYGAATRSSLEKMQTAGLTHVVCVRSNVEAHLIRANHMDHFQYLLVQMDDSPLESIIPHVKTVATFIDNCLHSGGKVLVHGNAGMCRSAALVIGYIMEKYGVTFKRADKYVQTKRFCIALNEVFRRQLLEYEPIYKAMHDAKMNAGEGIDEQFRMVKRHIDEVDVDQDDEFVLENQAVRPRMDGDDPNEMDMDL